MKEAQEFMGKYEDVSNLKVHGNINFVAQFINERFPNEIEPRLAFIDVGNIDIEVASDDGFPRPEQAAHPIISIAYKSSKSNIFYVWGLDEYDYTKTELDLGDKLIRYVKCDSEGELIQRFLVFWAEHTPDIITGWNIRLFDIPYMINRTIKVCGEKKVWLYLWSTRVLLT
jgi:DNA polymerase elongation subunit (family B)